MRMNILISCTALLWCSVAVQAQSPDELLAQFEAAVRSADTVGDEKAAARCEQILAIAIRNYGANNEPVARSQRELAIIYVRLDQYAKAEPLLKAALAMAERLGGRDHVEVAITQYHMAILYHKMGEYGKAEDNFMRCLTITQAKFGRDHPDCASGYISLAELYIEMGKYDDAKKWLFPALNINETKLGKNDRRTGDACFTLGSYYQAIGEYAKAEEHYLRCQAIYEAKLGKTDLATGMCLNNLAVLYQEMGQYSKGEQLLTRAIQFAEAQVGKDHPGIAMGLHNLGLLYHSMGQYVQAEATYQRSIAIHEAKVGKESLRTAMGLHNLADLYRIMGQYAKAEELFQRSLRIIEGKLGKDHPHTAINLMSLAEMYRASKQWDAAEKAYGRSLQVIENKLGKDHAKTATVVRLLAQLHSERGQHDQAEPLFTRALAIYAKRHASNHPAIGSGRKNLGELYHAMGKHALADEQLTSAVTTLKEQLGSDHPETALALSGRAAVQMAIANPTMALTLQDQAMQSLRRHTVAVLPILAEHEQLAFLQTSHDRRLALGLAMGLQPKLTVTQRQQVAQWLLNGKGVAIDVVSELLLLAREADTPEARSVLAELAEVRQQRAVLLINTEKARAANVAQALEARERRLATSLKKFDRRDRRDDPWYSLDELRQRLPANGAFIDIARIPLVDFKTASNGAEHYVAFVSKRTVATQIVDLGPAKTVDAAIQAVRQELDTASKTITQRGEAQAETVLRERLQRLAKLVLQPLQVHLEDSPTWIISPDSNLWLFPWAILPLDDKTYAIEKHAIRYVVSGRDLLTNRRKSEQPTSSSVIVADPDFDFGSRAKSDTPKPELRGLTLGNVPRLPGTAAEAEAITPRIEKFSGQAPRVVTDREATAKFVSRVQRPRVLVLSTHGFFMADEPTARRENPLLRCGLLFAGCNRPTTGPTDDTGVLRGTQIIGCDLRGTQLVVLSACETGLGDVQNGQGVAGLRQAFQLAGATNVVATLWQIPDLQSAQLMVQFFDGLANGQGCSAALQQAQRAMIQKRRDRFGAAHPFFWAAYTVTGQEP